MKTCQISEAKAKLGRLADKALAGEPTLITRNGQILVLQRYIPAPHPDEFDAAIDSAKKSPARELKRENFQREVFVRKVRK
jgi:antitoxin (DNA-binding transcriptional repressor) of toxin-antitoxin stability system